MQDACRALATPCPNLSWHQTSVALPRKPPHVTTAEAKRGDLLPRLPAQGGTLYPQQEESCEETDGHLSLQLLPRSPALQLLMCLEPSVMKGSSKDEV